jgi:hypothetical protein
LLASVRNSDARTDPARPSAPPDYGLSGRPPGDRVAGPRSFFCQGVG